MGTIQTKQAAPLDSTVTGSVNVRPIANMLRGQGNQPEASSDAISRINRLLNSVADGFDQMQTQSDAVLRILKTAPSAPTEFFIVDQSGALIAWLGNKNVTDSAGINRPYFGGYFRQLYVGGNNPTDAPLFADTSGNVIVGKNGSISIRDLGNNEVGWQGVRTDSPLTITATSNGSPDVLSIPGHTYQNGETVLVQHAMGDTGINGYRIVQNAITGVSITMTTLAGVPINGTAPYLGSGSATRYFAGAWFQSFAIGGTSVTTAKIRGFADGSVLVNANLVVNSGGTTTSINNSSDVTTGVVGLRMKNNTPPSQDIIGSDKGFYIRATDQTTYICSFTAPGDAGRLRVANLATGAFSVVASGGGGTFFSATDGTNDVRLAPTQLVFNATQVLTVQQAAVGLVTGTAGATYTAAEQTMLNLVKTKFNLLISRLGTAGHGLTAD